MKKQYTVVHPLDDAPEERVDVSAMGEMLREVVAVCTPGVSDSHHAPSFLLCVHAGYENEVMKMRPRPTPGETTERELSVDVCGECGYAIDMGMCDYDCKYDGDTNRPVIIRARYKRTDVFLGDEVRSLTFN